LARVVDDRNFLLDFSTGRDSEFKLRLNLLRDSGELVFIEPDISAVNRLQDNIARVRSRLGGVAVKLE